jgi:hypothetical protein
MNILDKLYLNNFDSAKVDICNFYKINWFCIVNFLYFANFVSNKLDVNTSSEYYNSLMNSSFLLPDWIALKLLYKKIYKLELNNLNWTDFVPYFLDSLWKNNFNLILYWAKSKTFTNVYDKYKIVYNIYYYQDW